MGKPGREAIRNAVLGAVKRAIEVAGHEVPDLTGDTCPIGQLGFDSVVGVENTGILEAELGCEISAENVFVDETGRRPLSIDEVVTRLARAVSEASLG
jgi:acyl carrier protein